MMCIPRPSSLRLSLAVAAAFSLLAACGEPADDDPPADTGPNTSADTGPDASSDTGDDTGAPDADDDAGTADSDTADSGTNDAGMTDTGPPLTTEDYPLAQCDALDPARCSLPWPSNLYLAPDAERTTGFQLRFAADSLPATRSGRHIDPLPYRRLDGYGLGTPIMTVFPKLDTSGMPDRFDIAGSVDPRARIVLLEVRDDGSTERVPYWAELDAQAEKPDEQVLFVRPAAILEEDTRYVVAFRNLKTTDGDAIQAGEAFRKLRDDEVDAGSVLAQRQPRFEEVFELLEDAGVSRDSLVLAWDFRTASSDGLHGRMLKMRRDAIRTVGDKGPELDFDMTDIKTFARPGEAAMGQETDPHIGLEIEGTFEVPHYMQRESSYWIFNLDEAGEVAQNGTRAAKFLMRVPHSALASSGGTPEEVGVVLYGHGLLGSRHEIQSDVWGMVADQYNYIFIATDWTGMASEDQQTAVLSTSDVSNFVGLADRLHQGILEFLLLGRTAKHRVPTMTELTERGVKVNADEVFYAGGSQGGIFGQTFMALSEDITRGFLAVPGNNYSTLLQRSVNFDQFLKLMRGSYPSPATRALCIGAMQLLWTGTDPVSYVRHIEGDPLIPGLADRDVLLAPSKGDHQVAVVTNEILARSDIGLPIVGSWDQDHAPWQTTSVGYPHDESGIVLFDFGNPWPERRNLPPDDMMDDPHDNLAQVPKAGQLIDDFFRKGEIINVCGMDGVCEF